MKKKYEWVKNQMIKKVCFYHVFPANEEQANGRFNRG